MRFFVLGLFWVTAPGCGSDDESEPAASSNVDGAKTVRNLTDAERGELCDWGASLFGGYGEQRTCSDGTFSSSAESREECVTDSALLECDATVDEFEACARAAHDQCMAGLFAPACEAVLPCAEGPTGLPQQPLVGFENVAR